MYAVAVQGLRLTIPNECPEMLKTLMQKCWRQEARSRPTFKEILKILDKIDLNNNEIEQQSLMPKNVKTFFRFNSNKLTKNLKKLGIFHSMFTK